MEEGGCHLDPGILGHVDDLDEVRITDADAVGPDTHCRAPLAVPVLELGVHLALESEARPVEVGEAGQGRAREVTERGEGQLVHYPEPDDGHRAQGDVGSR